MKKIDADRLCNLLLKIPLSDTVADSTRNLIVSIIAEQPELDKND